MISQFVADLHATGGAFVIFWYELATLQHALSKDEEIANRTINLHKIIACLATMQKLIRI